MGGGEGRCWYSCGVWGESKRQHLSFSNLPVLSPTLLRLKTLPLSLPSSPVKLYTIELALDAAERALGVALSRATRLPSARFAGGPPARHVPARAAPMVARASSQQKSGATDIARRPRGVDKVAAAAAAAPSGRAPSPPRVTWLRPGGAATGPVTSARITIALPPSPATGPLRVTATTDGRVRVARGSACLADTTLPLGLAATAATARLEEGARVLVVEAPVASVEEVVAAWASA